MSTLEMLEKVAVARALLLEVETRLMVEARADGASLREIGGAAGMEASSVMRRLRAS
jgi:hypothetical protein